MNPLSFLQSVAGFTQSQRNSSADRPVLLATIDPAYDPWTNYPAASDLPKVTFDGESTLSGKRYPIVNGYVPAPSDRVYMIPIGTTYLIAGRVGNPKVQGDYSNASTFFPNNEGFGPVAGPTPNQNLTSASYINMTGATTSFTFTKISPKSRLRVEVSATQVMSATDTMVLYGVAVTPSGSGTTNYDVARGYFNTVNDHLLVTGVTRISNLPAGSIGFQMVWLREAGPGTITRDLNDHLSLDVTEVA